MVLQSGQIYTQYYTDKMSDYKDQFSYNVEGDDLPVDVCVGCYLNEDHYLAVSDNK